jgi:hypothetical protein
MLREEKFEEEMREMYLSVLGKVGGTGGGSG